MSSAIEVPRSFSLSPTAPCNLRHRRSSRDLILWEIRLRPPEAQMCSLEPTTRRSRPAHRPMLFAATAALIALATPGLCGSAASAAERPPVMGRNAAVSAGHPLTSAAAFEVLTRGGNAFDAGVAALLVGGVVEQDLYSLGGEALVLVYPKSDAQGHRGRRPGLGARSARPSTGTWRAARRWTATGSIRPLFPARCMPLSRCWNAGAR